MRICPHVTLALAVVGCAVLASPACSGERDSTGPASSPPRARAPRASTPATSKRDAPRPKAIPTPATRSGFRVPTALDRQRAVGDPAMSATLDRAVHVHDSFEPVAAPEPGDWLAEHSEPGQTFAEFVASRPNRPGDPRRIIYFLPLGQYDPALGPSLDTLARHAEIFYGLPVRVLPAVPLAELDVRRRTDPGTDRLQLLTGDILAFAKKRLPRDAYCLIALTQVDLYPEPSWNFVFGQASLRERVGVHSFARYHPSFYDEEADEDRALVLRRSLEVMVHELGHMFGIQHCVFFRCVMAGSNSLAETDAHPIHLCPVELRKLAWSVGVDLLARYLELAAFYRAHGLTDEARWVRTRIAEIQNSGPNDADAP